MQAGDADRAPSEQAAEPTATKTDDDWGKFYSLPPKWKKDDAPSKSGLTDENIGHRLASLLRYHLDEDTGIGTDDQGWVTVDDIVARADEVGLGGCSAEDLIRVAETNEHSTRGRRFDSDGAGKIKAKYRHPPKDRRGDRWDGWRDSRVRRGGRYNRDSSGQGWQSNGWEDYNGRWKGWQDNGDETWTQWKKPGFSPSPDDTIVKESRWAGADDKPTQAETTDASPKEEADQSEKKACLWEQWFTPDSMEAYFYNTETEEVIFPGDAGDLEAKGWCRYEETEGERKGKIYWWHDESGRSFYEEDAIGDEDGAQA